MRHPVSLLICGALLIAPVAAVAADVVSSADKAFVAKVSQGGMFEVQAGQVAAERGSTQDVRDQGTTEAHDHGLVGDKLRTIAADGGITFSTSLNSTFQKKLDDLKALSGPAFDSGYLNAMETIHAQDGAAFALEATNGADPKLRAFAAETHRIVVRHIGELRALGPASE